MAFATRAAGEEPINVNSTKYMGKYRKTEMNLSMVSYDNICSELTLLITKLLCLYADCTHFGIYYL